MVLSVVFQLAHCVEQAEFPLPREDTGHIENAWAIHQVETTVDFARDSRVVTWLLGGLNFQIEHHLFPRICHVNYPAVSKLVEETCREFGVKYMEHKSLWAGVTSHFRWLRRMGLPSTAGRDRTGEAQERDEEERYLAAVKRELGHSLSPSETVLARKMRRQDQTPGPTHYSLPELESKA
jgi:fatty acid desaturase